MNRVALIAGILALATPVVTCAAGADPVARGRALVALAGCNDCHTAGYTAQAGKVRESQWLRGDRLGYAGPWGTTYASNLRLTLGAMDVETWKHYARGVVLRPPMPYWVLNTMEDADLEAIWHFSRSLGDPGDPAPAALPPGVEPPLPVFKLMLPPAASS